MNGLANVFIGKIAATLLFWSIPLICFPASLLEMAGLPPQPSYMFVRLLGWAYLALCVGYGFGLHAALQHQRAGGPVWVGIVSNGGACGYLAFYGLSGAWTHWGLFLQVLAWGSVVATAAITVGLYYYGVRHNAPVAPSPNKALPQDASPAARRG